MKKTTTPERFSLAITTTNFVLMGSVRQCDKQFLIPCYLTKWIGALNLIRTSSVIQSIPASKFPVLGLARTGKFSVTEAEMAMIPEFSLIIRYSVSTVIEHSNGDASEGHHLVSTVRESILCEDVWQLAKIDKPLASGERGARVGIPINCRLDCNWNQPFSPVRGQSEDGLIFLRYSKV